MDWWTSRSDIVRTFTSVGTFVIAMIAIFSIAYIVLWPEPSLEVHVTANPNSGTVPLTVEFSSTVTGGTPGYTYSWVFGDGETSSLSDPTHAYSSGGTFTATLLVSDSAGRSASDSIPISVTVPPLVVSLTADPDTGDVPLIVTFEATATGGAPPYSFEWRFGDDSADQGMRVTHTYNKSGTYAATVTVTDDSGQTESAVVNVKVEAKNDPGFEVGVTIAVIIALGLLWRKRNKGNG